MLIELFIKSYKLVKDNLILIQPLLIFLLLIGLILAPASTGGLNIALIFPIIGLYCAFGAGWFSMFHKSIQQSANKKPTAEEKAENTLNLLKEFFPGVVKYFLKVLAGVVVYSILLIIVVNFFGGIIGSKFIGFPTSVNSADLWHITMNSDNAQKLLAKISAADRIRILQWNLLSFSIMGIFSYLMMFWIQAMISEDKNPLSAYLESIRTVFKRPFTTLIIFISYWGSIIGISIVSSMNSLNVVIQILGLMLVTTATVYFTMMMFLYFEKYRKNTGNNWTNSFRQE